VCKNDSRNKLKCSYLKIKKYKIEDLLPSLTLYLVASSHAKQTQTHLSVMQPLPDNYQLNLQLVTNAIHENTGKNLFKFLSNIMAKNKEVLSSDDVYKICKHFCDKNCGIRKDHQISECSYGHFENNTRVDFVQKEVRDKMWQDIILAHQQQNMLIPILVAIPPPSTRQSNGRQHQNQQSPFTQAFQSSPFAQTSHSSPFAQTSHSSPFAQASQSSPFAQASQSSPFAQTVTPRVIFGDGTVTQKIVFGGGINSNSNMTHQSSKTVSFQSNQNSSNKSQDQLTIEKLTAEVQQLRLQTTQVQTSVQPTTSPTVKTQEQLDVELLSRENALLKEQFMFLKEQFELLKEKFTQQSNFISGQVITIDQRITQIFEPMHNYVNRLNDRVVKLECPSST